MILKRAVIVSTGARGTGKTLFSATYLPPGQEGRVFYHDSERSANKTVQDLEEMGMSFGHYTDLEARFSNLPSDDDLLTSLSKGKLPWTSGEQQSALVGYYHYILDDLDRNLKQGQFDVYVHDTLEKLEAGMAAWVESDIKQFGFRSVRDARKYGRIWSQAVYPLYSQLLASIFARGVKTIFLNSHLRTPWEGDRPVPGKVAPSGKKLLYRLTSLMLWLVNDDRNSDGAPAGLVLKERLGKLTAVGSKWVIRRMLPERIPHCTWEDINRYLEEGCDLARPSDGETMSRAEREMISELLTDEQMRLMILDAEKELEVARQGMRAPVETGGGGTFSLGEEVDPKVEEYKEKAVEMGLDEENRDEVRERLIEQWPPPLRAGRGTEVVDAAIEEVLGG